MYTHIRNASLEVGRIIVSMDECCKPFGGLQGTKLNDTSSARGGGKDRFPVTPTPMLDYSWNSYNNQCQLILVYGNLPSKGVALHYTLYSKLRLRSKF